MKNILSIFLIFMVAGAGLWIGYKNGPLKKPINDFLGKSKSASVVDVEPDKAENVLKEKPKIEKEKNNTKKPDNRTKIKTAKDPRVVTKVLPEDVKKTLRNLESAKNLGAKLKYKEARRLLKETRELNIDSSLQKKRDVLSEKYFEFDRMTRFIEEIPLKGDGGIDIVEFSSGNISEGEILERDSDKVRFHQFSSGIKGVFPSDRIDSVRSLSATQAKDYFSKEFKKKIENGVGGGKNLYEAIEYACQYNLNSELHTLLETTYQKNPKNLKAAAEVLAQKNYRKYVWSKMKGKKVASKKYLKRVLSAFKDTNTARLALEDEAEEKDPSLVKAKLKTIIKETKAKPLAVKPVSASHSSNDIEKQADGYNKKGMTYIKKAQPGMPESDKYLAKARKEFEKAVNLYDQAIMRAESKGKSTGSLDSKIERASEMLYFCIKQTRLTH